MRPLLPLDTPDAEARVVSALRVLAGAAADRDAFTFTRQGVAVTVTYLSGSSTSLSLRAHYPSVPTGTPLTGHLRAVRPMALALRPEVDSDRRAKRRGISVETQTDDALFDTEVYVETPSPPEVARRVLAEQALRDAVRELLRVGVGSLVIDDDHQSVHVQLTARTHFEAWSSRASLLVDLFTTVARLCPKVETRYGDEHPAPPGASTAPLAAVALVATVAMVGCILTLPPDVCRGPCTPEGCPLLVFNDPRCWQPHAMGLTLAAMMWVGAQVFIGRRLVGRSDSHRLRTAFAIASACAAIPVGEVVGMVTLWLGR